MEMLTEGPSASLACLNKDVADGSIRAGCQRESPSADVSLQFGSVPSGGSGGKVTPPRRPPRSCTHAAGRSSWPPALGLRATGVQEEKKYLRSSQEKGKRSKGELEEKLNKDLQNLLTHVLSPYAHGTRHTVSCLPSAAFSHGYAIPLQLQTDRLTFL